MTQETQGAGELLYALDIGTGSVTGLLARREGDRMRVLELETRPHEKRAMLDGQIEDIGQVARVVAQVTRTLEERTGDRLTRACVAAAGRALRTQTGEACLELSAPEMIREERIKQLELAAVAQAEQSLREEGQEQGLFLVGYTVKRYQLDRYPLTTLEGHTGQVLQAEVVATFLPREVVDSLYAVMRRAGLEVASLTLEPIAALNAAIPEDIRLLNLALVDIGAGTSDIALCRDGGVVGYTMATVAGDEITEGLMRGLLVDFRTAEDIKRRLGGGEERVSFTDILGLEHSLPRGELLDRIGGESQALAEEIARRVLELNGGPPSALFLAGGGSKLSGLRERVAQALGMELNRVAVAGRYFDAHVCSDDYDLNDPAYTTPLGIVISSGLGLISDGYRVTLNGQPARLFRSGQVTALELLMMNGYTYADLLGRTGRSLVLWADGRRLVYHGEPAVPARLLLNGKETPPSAVVQAGDELTFEPARPGRDRTMTAGQLARELGAAGVRLDGVPLEPDAPLAAGMRLETQAGQPEPPAPAGPAGRPLSLELNGRPLRLPPKGDGAPYYLMDLLERSGLDFQSLDRPVRLRVNGAECTFRQRLNDQDKVEIRYEKND